MITSLAGKIALVTGSTSGIGLACAQELAKAGSNLCLNGFGDPNIIKNLMNQIEKENKVKVIYENHDLRKPTEIQNMISNIQRRLGQIDILINNAGMQFVTETENFPDEKYYDIINLNLNSYFHASKLVLPGMKKKNWGRIINIASVHGLVASVGKSAYVSAKHGVIGQTKVIALENAQTGVTCNAICPGWTLTQLIKDQIVKIQNQKNISFEQATEELLREKQPSRKFVLPSQIGQTAVFLCSDAASEIRGIAIPIDGGWTAQ